MDIDDANPKTVVGNLKFPATGEQLCAGFETPFKLWTGFAACGIADVDTAKILSRNLFVDNCVTCM